MAHRRFGLIPAPVTLVALVCLTLACAPAREPRAPLFSRWVSPLGREHPLVGKIWDVAHGAFVSEHELLRVVAASTFVGIGEQHDNADHHSIQGRVIEALVSEGRKPGVVFEMLDRDEEAAVHSAIATHPRDPDAVSSTVDWAHSGWPSWSIYRPVFLAAVSNDLLLVAGGVDRKAAMKLVADGPAAVPPELVRDYGLDAPPSGAVLSSLRAEMRDAHCGLLPDSMLDGMVFVQRVRDAMLADGMARAGPSRGAVLIAGNGHVRRDRGVPALVWKKTGVAVVAVGLIEVRDGATSAPDYAAAFDNAGLPFDYVVFTPRSSDADRCNEIRRKHGGGAG